MNNKHVVVSGGGTGVGAQTAQVFAANHAKVTILGRTESSLVAQALPYQVCDVTDPQSVQRAFANAREVNGPISIVVANAGAAQSVPFAKVTPDHFNELLAVNLTGVMNCWQAALTDMKSNKWGRMIAIASTAGLKGFPYVSSYCAAKHGVIGLTRALAIELAKTGITVNAICPGFTETPMLQRSIDNITNKTTMTTEQAIDTLKAGNPQGRFIEPDEIAQTALWLASDAAKSVNGHALSIAGGEI